MRLTKGGREWPWRGCRAFALAFSFCGALLHVACATPAYRDLSIGGAGASGAQRPADLPRAETVLKDCVGVQMAPYYARFGCRDGHEVIAVGFQEPPGPEGCARALQGAEVQPGPDLPLPAGALTYKVSQQTSACVPASKDGVTMYGAFGLKGPAPEFVASVLPPLAYDGVPAGDMLPRQPESLDVFGRPIRVPRWCRLMGPRNLACGTDGQVSWTIHSSLEGAQRHQGDQIDSSIERGSEVLARSTVDCTFEGTNTKCEWIKYRLPLPFPNSLWESGVLITWYATAPIRGANVQLVCSYFEDTVRRGEISRLCQQFLEFLED